MTTSQRDSNAERAGDLSDADLTSLVAGEAVSEVRVQADRVEVRFASGRSLVIEHGAGDALRASLQRVSRAPPARREPGQPTPRQREYLDFIVRFMARFGVAPAESDIARHFMVSAPSVNQMLRTLEARGFISRGFDPFTGHAAARSIRILVDL